MNMSVTKSRQQNVDTSTSLFVVELLKLMKSRYDYRELSKITGLPISTLTRYVTNKTLPRGAKTRDLLNRLIEDLDIPSMVRERIRMNNGFVDITPVVTDGSLLKLITLHAVHGFAGSKITGVISLDEAGIPIATCIGLMMDRKIFYISDKLVWDADEALQLTYYVKETEEYKSVWLQRSAINKKENLLAVVGVLKQPALIRELNARIIEAGGTISGLFSVVALENALAELSLVSAGRRISLLTV